MCDDQNCGLSQHPNRLPPRLAFNESIDLGKGKLIQEHLHSFFKIDAVLFAIDPRLDLIPFKLLHIESNELPKCSYRISLSHNNYMSHGP